MSFYAEPNNENICIENMEKEFPESEKGNAMQKCLDQSNSITRLKTSFQTLTARRSLGAKSNEGVFSICAQTMKSRQFPMEFETIGYSCPAIWFRFLFFFEYVQQEIIKVEN